MTETIQDNKYVELTYEVLDKKTEQVLTLVEFPIGYVHGVNETLAPQVADELEGKSMGEILKIPIDCNQLYGPRDESLVFTDHIDNVPEEYREIGMTILMENENGDPKEFIVTRMDDESLTVDGNNPLSGREVIFKLEILMVRDASNEEIEAGGKVDADPDIEDVLKQDEGLWSQAVKKF